MQRDREVDDPLTRRERMAFTSLERTVCCSCSCVRRRWDSPAQTKELYTLYTLYTYLCSRWALLDDVDDYDFHSWTHAAHELLPVHHAERRVGLVLELHLVYSALLLLLLRRMTSIQSTGCIPIRIRPVLFGHAACASGP